MSKRGEHREQPRVDNHRVKTESLSSALEEASGCEQAAAMNNVTTQLWKITNKLRSKA